LRPGEGRSTIAGRGAGAAGEEGVNAGCLYSCGGADISGGTAGDRRGAEEGAVGNSDAACPGRASGRLPANLPAPPGPTDLVEAMFHPLANPDGL